PRERVRAGALLPDAHHRQREVRRDHAQAGDLPPRLKRDIPRASGDIEQPATARQARLLHDEAPPALVLPEGHQAVHQVIARGDLPEHRLDGAPMLGSWQGLMHHVSLGFSGHPARSWGHVPITWRRIANSPRWYAL